MYNLCHLVSKWLLKYDNEGVRRVNSPGMRGLVLFLLDSEQVGSLVFSNDRKNMPKALPVSEGYDRYTAKSDQNLKGTTVCIITVAMVSQ